ncbi:MAG: lipid A deacylase LpxR family protein [Candidatus Thiodiazotropha sp. (ex Monitilora ramsayi)]|nr:lipid A deacylase LpxR family protein [Candidatus Thiodiazotropha sp. (ex Monitilora ramsayi)]
MDTCSTIRHSRSSTWFRTPGSLSLVFILCLISFSTSVAADTQETGFWSIQLENDLWGSGDDRFYTHGTEISYASVDTPPKFLTSLSDSLPFYRKGGFEIHGYSLGQTIFTPEDIEQETLVEDDRPYAGWLFLDMGIAHLYEDQGDREKINGLILTLGVVGPISLAEQVQRGIHRLTGSDNPRGWDNQLENELGINLTYLRKWRRLFPLQSSRSFELSHHGGLTLGNVYTYASLGVMARWGTRLKNDIGPPTISPGFPGIPAFRPDPTFNWYLFAGVEARAMARNIFLDGNTFRDSHSVDKKPLVGDLQFGFAFHFNDTRIAFSHMIRSREFEGQSDPAQYGAINITVYSRP